MFKPGWLHQQFESAKKEVSSWPQWKKEVMGCVPHEHQEGSREHATWWDSYGIHCRHAKCELNHIVQHNEMA